MNFTTSLIKNIIYPLVEFKNHSRMLEYLHDDERTQYMSSSEMKGLQWSLLENLLKHAYDNTFFYRQRFRSAGLRPGQIKDPDDLLALPILSKEDIQQNIEGLIATGLYPNTLIEDYTGGSTGKPLKFYYNEERSQRRAASRIRHNRWSGWDIGEKMAVLWGAPSDIADRSFKKKVKNLILNRTVSLDSFDMTEENMEAYTAFMEKYRPAAILAYANSIYLYARFLKERSHSIHPKGIICSAETLTPEKRSLIESVFNCKAFDRYGSREVGLIASECECHRGMHINAENIYLEVINASGKHADEGEVGKVIVTDLHNYSMPFIRYEIGDMAVASYAECECGRGLPLVSNIEGRVSDFIVTPSGRMVHGEYFTHLFYGIDGVMQFQLIQEDIRGVYIDVVPGEGYSQETIEKIKAKARDYLGKDMRVEVRKVKSIPKTATGKYRFTISRIGATIVGK